MLLSRPKSRRSRRADRLVLDWNDYQQLFKDARRETAVGEASVAYLASLHAAVAIRARLPDARIVMMLRNPIDRVVLPLSCGARQR